MQFKVCAPGDLATVSAVDSASLAPTKTSQVLRVKVVNGPVHGFLHQQRGFGTHIYYSFTMVML